MGIKQSLVWVTGWVLSWVARMLNDDARETESSPERERFFEMTMLGMSQFYNRLDPMVEAGVSFDIVNDGIMVYTFIPKSQLRNLLVREEF